MKGVMSHIGTNLPIRGTHASNMRKSIIGHEHHPIRHVLASRMGFPVGTWAPIGSMDVGLSGAFFLGGAGLEGSRIRYWLRQIRPEERQSLGSQADPIILSVWARITE